jgi:hypothetical protein
MGMSRQRGDAEAPKRHRRAAGGSSRRRNFISTSPTARA